MRYGPCVFLCSLYHIHMIKATTRLFIDDANAIFILWHHVQLILFSHQYLSHVSLVHLGTHILLDIIIVICQHQLIKVVVFSKSWCPYCNTTKQLFSSKGIDFKVIELDKVDNGDEIHGALMVISGQRTVPNVFIKGQHLGGNDDTHAADRSGKLQEMLGK